MNPHKHLVRNAYVVLFDRKGEPRCAGRLVSLETHKGVLTMHLSNGPDDVSVMQVPPFVIEHVHQQPVDELGKVDGITMYRQAADDSQEWRLVREKLAAIMLRIKWARKGMPKERL